MKGKVSIIYNILLKAEDKEDLNHYGNQRRNRFACLEKLFGTLEYQEKGKVIYIQYIKIKMKMKVMSIRIKENFISQFGDGHELQ